MATSTSSISLVNVVRYYEPTRYAHQRNALDWLQHQTASATLTAFVQRWNNPFGTRLPMLVEGNRNEAVAELQVALNRWNIPVSIDGEFGRFTKAAVIRFQQQRNLKADGIVGNKTWSELFKSAGTLRLAELLDLNADMLDVCPYGVGDRSQALAERLDRKGDMLAQHTAALNWLQSQLSRTLLSEFDKRWRNQVQ